MFWRGEPTRPLLPPGFTFVPFPPFLPLVVVTSCSLISHSWKCIFTSLKTPLANRNPQRPPPFKVILNKRVTLQRTFYLGKGRLPKKSSKKCGLLPNLRPPILLLMVVLQCNNCMVLSCSDTIELEGEQPHVQTQSLSILDPKGRSHIKKR